MKTISLDTVLTDGTNQYVVEEFLGDGGFANVFRATSEGESYAIKVLINDNPKYLNSLKNEFDIASQISSEHAIKYYYLNEHGQNDFPCFIIMEYANGGDLSKNLEMLKSIGASYATDKLFEIYMQLINGMIDISPKAVHRDIKPKNSLISNGRFKISDYGLAKYANEATRSASKTMKGWRSVLYYAPELWDDPAAHNKNTTQVDIYAMGIVFYEIANLTYPYDYGATTDFRNMHRTASIKLFKSDVDPVYEGLIRKMMAKSTTERFDTWESIKEFLCNSNLGSGSKRDPFVESLIKNATLKKHGIDSKRAKETKEATEKKEAFRMLESQIETNIYNPLKHIVDEFNSNTTIGKISLSKIEIDDDNEQFSFQYIVEPISEEEDERLISFEFMAMHTEKLNNLRMISTGMYYDDRNELLNNIVDPSPKTIEYKYYKNRILLWGTIKADCGVGINIAIVDNPSNSLYGILKMFLRVPNIKGWNYWLPIETKGELKEACLQSFHELNYTTNVKDFDFNTIKYLISQNDTFDIDFIKDPFAGNGLIPKLF